PSLVLMTVVVSPLEVHEGHNCNEGKGSCHQKCDERPEQLADNRNKQQRCQARDQDRPSPKHQPLQSAHGDTHSVMGTANLIALGPVAHRPFLRVAPTMAAALGRLAPTVARAPASTPTVLPLPAPAPA